MALTIDRCALCGGIAACNNTIDCPYHDVHPICEHCGLCQEARKWYQKAGYYPSWYEGEEEEK